MRLHHQHQRRTAIAAVEFAAVLPVLFILLLGTWEIARVVQVQQVMVNAVREGARIAAQGQTINLTGAYTQINAATGTPNVKDTVLNYLIGAGLTNTTGATVTFQFTNGDTSKTQPFEATKDQQYLVQLTLPYDNVRLTTLNMFNFGSLTARVDWVSMVDDSFQINTTIPTWTAVQ